MQFGVFMFRFEGSNLGIILSKASPPNLSEVPSDRDIVVLRVTRAFEPLAGNARQRSCAGTHAAMMMCHPMPPKAYAPTCTCYIE